MYCRIVSCDVALFFCMQSVKFRLSFLHYLYDPVSGCGTITFFTEKEILYIKICPHFLFCFEDGCLMPPTSVLIERCIYKFLILAPHAIAISLAMLAYAYAYSLSLGLLTVALCQSCTFCIYVFVLSFWRNFMYVKALNYCTVQSCTRHF